jgi:hypothetical protein
MPCDSRPKVFKYNNIAPGRHEIRIIILQPGSLLDDIVWRVEHMSLDKSPVYEALSDTWGEPPERKNKVQITLGEAPFPITQNLACALRHLRLGKAARNLWVDAICIHQDDIEERNNQVQQMARIYKMAKHVHVWIGPENDFSKVAMPFLKVIDTKVLACMDSKRDLTNVHQWIKTTFEDPGHQNTWVAVAQLWQRGYWSRVWIIQEVVFGTSKSRQCIVHCGCDSIAWETLVALDRAMTLIDPSCYDNEHSDVDILQVSKGARLDLSWFIAVHGEHTRNKELPLSYLLIRQSRCKATDPRDKVYALLSMVHESQADGLVVDYGLSTAEVYTMAMKEMVLREKRLGVLCACCRECRNQDPLDALPSWCPDFSTDPMDKCCPARLWSYTKPVYYASGDLHAEARFVLRDGRPVLLARGWRLDTITVLEHDAKYKIDGPGCGVLSPQCLLFLAQGIGGENPTYVKDISEAAHEAIWRTLVANRGQSHNSAPESFAVMYKLLIAKHINIVEENVNGIDGAVRDKVELSQHITPFISKMHTCLYKRHLSKSVRLHLPGLVPNTAKNGDVIVILIGCALPIILRWKEDRYIVIGESYVHGFMYSEILEIRGLETEEFIIY